MTRPLSFVIATAMILAAAALALLGNAVLVATHAAPGHVLLDGALYGAAWLWWAWQLWHGNRGVTMLLWILPIIAIGTLLVSPDTTLISPTSESLAIRGSAWLAIASGLVLLLGRITAIVRARRSPAR